MSGPREPQQGGSGWLVALFALPVLCCSAPAVLAALGAGSVGALLGGATGSAVLADSGVAVACVALAVLARRRRARR